ncbi:MAG: UvrB/UvrC motif-containing protein [Nanoarchaeota archaeon]
MSEEGLKMFLFLPQEEKGQKLTDSYIAVKQAYIKDTIAEKTERVAGFGVIFTTRMNAIEVRENLRMKDSPYLLVELTGNVTEESIAGFFPDTDIEELRNLNLDSLKDNAQWLEKELNKAIEREDYKKAAEIRDKINENKNDD